MAKKAFTPEQIINKPREAEIQINQGISIPSLCRTITCLYYSIVVYRTGML